MPNKRKSAFSNAGGDGYFGVGGYVKKQDDASKSDASKAFGDKYSKVVNQILVETPLTESDVKGKTIEEIVSMIGDSGKSVSSKTSRLIRSLVKDTAKKLKKKEE